MDATRCPSWLALPPTTTIYSLFLWIPWCATTAPTRTPSRARQSACGRPAASMPSIIMFIGIIWNHPNLDIGGYGTYVLVIIVIVDVIWIALSMFLEIGVFWIGKMGLSESVMKGTFVVMNVS